MLLHVQRHLFSTAVGAVAGATVGLVGWGGAQVIIPAMTLPLSVASFSQLSATGISLTSLSVSTVSSAYTFWEENRVNIPLAVAIGLPSVFSARIGSHYAKKLSGDALALFYNGFSIILIPTHFFIQQRASERRLLEVPGTGDETSSIKLKSISPLLLQHASFGVVS